MTSTDSEPANTTSIKSWTDLVLNKLQCPKCHHREFELKHMNSAETDLDSQPISVLQSIECKGCGQSYSMIDGIVDFA